MQFEGRRADAADDCGNDLAVWEGEGAFYCVGRADVALDNCEVAGLLVEADAFGCEGGGEFGGCAREGCAGVVVLEGEGEAVACAVACCAEKGEGFGLGHCVFVWWDWV